jgi:hypothetical protein
MVTGTLGLLDAALWGLAGGTAAAIVSFVGAVRAAGFRLPWRTGNDEREAREEFWARLLVLGGGITLGTIVSAAAHSQMSGPWPAFIIGVGAEASVRGMLAGVDVSTRKPETGGAGDGPGTS